MSQKRHILLIGKDINLRDAGVKMFAAAGHSVHTASTMRDALAEISSEPIGLIVCGLELEDILATDFLAYLKNDPLRDTIPFVFYIHTQSQVDLLPKRAMDLGADDVILYPIAADKFLHRIGRFLPPIGSRDESTPDAQGLFPESFLPQKKEPPAEKEKMATGGKGVRLSLDGKSWAECHVLNHTFHGAMVETRLRGKQGSSVMLRYDIPGVPLTATGRLIHILLGDHERPMGMGINFRSDSNWRQIHSHMKSAVAGAEASPVAPQPQAPTVAPKPLQAPRLEENALDRRIIPETRIGIEVSRDDALWMYGEITAYDGIGVSITTPVLGKSGETLHVRFTTPREQKVLKGRIKTVTLNNFKMPAGMDIIFPEKTLWLDIAGRFSETEAPRTQTEDTSDDIPAPPPRLKSPTRSAGDKLRKQDWAETVVGLKNPPEAESIKNRFYKSLIGKKLGNYEIASFLNSGSMGGVFKGWDIALERDVAIKVISYELSSKEEFVEMFFKEARLVSKLNHPNIAHIYFIGNETGIVYYAMEFIHGYTLAELMENTHCGIRPEKAAGYLADACRALDRVWQEKIIHRDIKPANIMISEHDTVKLLDFGVAQQQKKGGVSSNENIVGSPPYLSPETIREEPVDLRSDIYSLGATFYHVLCGAPPFTDDSLEGLLRKHLDTPPIPLKETLPDLPAALGDIVHKMLAKQPEDRFQSYQEIIGALPPVPTGWPTI